MDPEADRPTTEPSPDPSLNPPPADVDATALAEFNARINAAWGAAHEIAVEVLGQPRATDVFCYEDGAAFLDRIGRAAVDPTADLLAFCRSYLESIK